MLDPYWFFRIDRVGCANGDLSARLSFMQLAALVLKEKLCSGVKGSGDKALIAERSTLQLKLNFSTQCIDISN